MSAIYSTAWSLDGEFLILEDGTIVPPDGFEPLTAGPKWNMAVVGYKIGTALTRALDGLQLHRRSPYGRGAGAALDRARRFPLPLAC